MSRVEKRKQKQLAFALIAGVACGGFFALRYIKAERARKERGCVALTRALDRTVRARSPRYFEGIVQHQFQRDKDRCLASLEYHYKPCDAELLKKTPLLCTGPDADIAIYSFQEGEAHPLFICERNYEPAEARCTESVYGTDGSLLSSREFPPDQFPAIKSELFPSTP